MAQLPAPYYYGPDRFIRIYDKLLERTLYWPWPMSSITGNYVTLARANDLFLTTPGAPTDLRTELPEGVSDTGASFGDNLQSMFDQGNRVKQSIVTEGG